MSSTSSVASSPLQLALSRAVLKRSFLVALIVGTILNLINQGDALMTFHGINTVKLLLTYCVPFCVSTHGAYTAFSSASSSGRR